MSMETSAALFEANRQALNERYPSLAEAISQTPASVELRARGDGFFYAVCQYQSGCYAISRDEAVARDLHGFRREIGQGLQAGADLIFIFGVGLGYRVNAAVEVLQTVRQGVCVVLEQSLDLLSAACRCSDLREAFGGPRCQWLAPYDLQEAIRERIGAEEWYGAQKTLFYWGYQTKEVGSQPNYTRYSHLINQWAGEERRRFFKRWRHWVESRAHSRQFNKVAVIAYEQESQSCRHPAKRRQAREQVQGNTVVEVPLSVDGFVPQTRILNAIIRHDADCLLCAGFSPQRWVASEALNAMPIPIETV